MKSASVNRMRARPHPREDDVVTVVATLKRLGSRKTLDGMSRYAIPSDRAFGVPVGTMQKLARKLGRNHELAVRLWKTGWYEARMMCAFLDEPSLVTPAQMDRWCRDFDSWAIVDTVCFHLFDRAPHAPGKVATWCNRRAEFQKRAGFALLACLALHNKDAADEEFIRWLTLVGRGATDERNFVKKGVSWALRSIGRRSAALHARSLELAKRLANSRDAPSRWVGKDALRDLTRPALMKRFSR
ncbi:MAG: DNA alkylation repair protein [Tepidisphaeraceae bacterium]